MLKAYNAAYVFQTQAELNRLLIASPK